MLDELRGEYENESATDMVLVRSTPSNAETADLNEGDYLKVLYIKDYVDEAGFLTMQIKTLSNNGEVEAIVVYGRHMISGLAQVFVHEIGQRMYPHMTEITSIHVGLEGIEAWENDTENNVDVENMKGFVERLKRDVLSQREDEEE